MQYKFFNIPTVSGDTDAAEEEMNAFLRGHRVLTVQRELVNDGGSSFWSCCVEYIDGAVSSAGRLPGGKAKVDYRTVLNDADFERFRVLRECRNLLAKEDAVPPFAVFLDEQLAAMLELPELTPASLKTIAGIGEKKAEKYGPRFIELWEKRKNEESGKSVSPDSGNGQS